MLLRQPATSLLPIPDAKGDKAAQAVVQQEADRHVLETRHHGLNRGCLYENGFRELQPIDLPCGNDHHLKPLKNGRF